MSATPAGQRRVRIELQRLDTGQDEYGEEASSWSSLGFARAKVLYGTGSERREAAAQAARQTATFRVLSTTLTRGVGVKDRIVQDGRAWDIAAFAPIDGPPNEIEFTATSAV